MFETSPFRGVLCASPESNRDPRLSPAGESTSSGEIAAAIVIGSRCF
jgi:hypothetical protein